VKQTRADNTISLVQGIGLHVLLFALLFAGFKLPHDVPMQAAQGDPIEADLVSATDLSAAMQRALQRKPVEPEHAPTPVPEPLPQPLDETPPPKLAELPPPVPDPAPIEQDKVQRDAVLPPPANVQKEQDEKRRKPDQAELDAPKPDPRQRVLEEIRRQRELAARERSMAEQRAQQLADARTTTVTPNTAPSRPPPGDPDSRLRKSASYQVALMNAILRQWTRPDSVRLGQICEVLIKQIPGGEVVSVQVSPGCPYDELGRRSVEAAVLKASPLPYAGFEDVFVRNPVLKFRAEDL
jgi:colicin import membrane protein